MIASLAQRAGVPKPKVYVTPAERPNAFATGRNPAHSAIAVTQGITRALSPRELEGVLAHEMAHIRNRDILIASVAAMVAGAIAGIANWLQFSLLFGGGDDEGGSGIIGSIATIIFAPIAALLIQMAISRQREYVADATGAELIGDPLPLADALETLHRGSEAIPMRVNPAAEPLYIVNPLRGNSRSEAQQFPFLGGPEAHPGLAAPAMRGRGLTSLFSTHPSMAERVARLRAMRGVEVRRVLAPAF